MTGKINIMTTILVAIVLVVAFILITKVSQGASGANLGNAKEKIKQGALVLDVRTPGEYQSGHYTKAVNIPVQELQARLAEVGNDKKRPVVVYCASGMRSAQAARILTAAGFTDVTNAGGLRNLQP